MLPQDHIPVLSCVDFSSSNALFQSFILAKWFIHISQFQFGFSHMRKVNPKTLTHAEKTFSMSFRYSLLMGIYYFCWSCVNNSAVSNRGAPNRNRTYICTVKECRPIPFRRWKHMAGIVGIEPTPKESKSCMLPLHNIPIFGVDFGSTP